MKFDVKQMQNWNCYAYYAEDVPAEYWDYFRDDLWWQLGNGFIKTFDNVEDFSYCAANFSKYGEISMKQQLKILPAPWRKALERLIPEMKACGVSWYLHGSTAMALWGIAVQPKDINVVIPNYSDYGTVRTHFYKMAVKPFQRCDNWVASGLGTVFLEANIGFSFGNWELEPYQIEKHPTVIFQGERLFVSSLPMLKEDNERFGRPERVKLIQKRMEELSHGK